MLFTWSKIFGRFSKIFGTETTKKYVRLSLNYYVILYLMLMYPET